MSFPIVVGNPNANFWLFDKENNTFDLTHPPTSESPTLVPYLRLTTATVPILISPAKTALVIVDMQNFFLSPALGRPATGPGHDAEAALLSHAIPAARRAGIQIVHLTWGLSDSDLETLPPVLFRAFGFRRDDADGEGPNRIGLGDQMGEGILPDGTTVWAGRMLVGGEWNTALHQPLQDESDAAERRRADGPRDVRFDKMRISGFCHDRRRDGPPAIQRFLEEKGITTLLFAGVNTDQCVLGSLQDACNAGFDTVLLRDCVGTSSPDFARQMVEFNCRRSWGFVSSGEELGRAVGEMESE